MKLVGTNGTDILEIDITPPQYGYVVRYHMATQMFKSASGYSFYDMGVDSEGVNYDYVELELPDWIMPKSEFRNFVDFLDDFDKGGRGRAFTLYIDEASSNFFPAGPQYGDTGNFGCQVASKSFGGNQLSPWNYGSSKIVLIVEHHSLTTSMLAQIPQGKFSIGNINYLPFPENGFSPKVDYKISTAITLTGGVSHVLSGPDADLTTTEFILNCNLSNAGRLINYMAQTARNTPINISAPINYNMFGVDDGAAKVFSCVNIDSVIECVHKDFDTFEIPLKFWKRALVQ